MDIITIDFETYYDQDYSLSKITTESYIRDTKFQVIGVSIKVNKKPAYWYSGDDIQPAFNQLDFTKATVLAHNCIFDGAILAWHYGIKPKYLLDTLSMARPYYAMTTGCSLSALAKAHGLGEKGYEVHQAKGKRLEDFTPYELKTYGRYCINDVELTYALFKKLIKQIPIAECMLINRVLKMYTEPSLIVDGEALIKYKVEIQQRKEKLLKALAKGGHENIKKILMSNDKFARLLKKCNVEPPRKISIRTGKEAYAFAKTDKGFTALLDHPNTLVQNLVAARLGVKSTIEETRTQNLIDVYNRGALPILLKYYGAHTGRFSGGDKLNLQNLPRNGAIRRAITAPKGYSIVACDLAQIEARLVAYIAKQQDLLDAFANGRDVYSEFASEIYSRRITKADKVERFVGKTCILGLGYNMGHEKFRNTLASGAAGLVVNLEEHEAKRIVHLYRQRNYRITAYWRKCQVAIKKMAGGLTGVIDDYIQYSGKQVLLPNGLHINYPKLCQTPEGYEYLSNARAKGVWTKIYGGKMTENVVQALARIVISEQMLTISKYYRVVFQVHDEIVVIVKDKELPQAKQFITNSMSRAPNWAPGLPISCEIGIGKNYADAK